MADTPHRRQILGLDLLRFIAACLVMALHLGFWSWWPAGGSINRAFPDLPSYPELISATWFGWVGVEIFFVLSGFVIAYSAASATASSFLRNRFLRLMPGIWICATISAIALTCSALPGSEIATRWFATMILLPFPRWVDGVYWSLVVEVVFYGLVFLMLLTGKLSRIHVFMGAIGLASAAYAVIGFITPLPTGLLYVYLLVEHGCHFALGVFLWMWLLQGRRYPLIIALLAIGGAAEVIHTAIRKASALGIDESPTAALFVWVVAILAMVGSVHFNEAVASRFGRYERGLRVLGLSTYPLYLLHSMVGAVVISFTHDIIGRWMALGAGITAAIAVSMMVATWAEPAIRRWVGDRVNFEPFAIRGRSPQA